MVSCRPSGWGRRTALMLRLRACRALQRLVALSIGFAVWTAGTAEPAAAQLVAPRPLFTFGQVRPQTPQTFGWVSGIAVDSATGDVYVPTTSIRRFDTNGNF